MSSHGKNILELYPWIDLNFVNNLITNSECDEDLIIESYQAENAVSEGQNYSSHMIRLIVHLKNKSDVNQMKMCKIKRTYFLKICLQTEEFLKICNECNLYEKEIEAYNRIIPAVEELLNSIQMKTQIAPKYV